MPEKISKNKNRVIIVEFEVRDIDEFGDSTGTEFFETEAEAVRFALAYRGAATATVIEEHISRRPSFLYAEPDSYTIVFTAGSRDALQAGGWIE